MELLAMVNLGERANFLPSQLSGGERQRVAIARALANRPVLLLADEPTGNLDSKSTAEIMALLRELNQQQGATIIVVTHNPIVARATRRIVTLRDGRIQRDQLVVSPYLADLRDFKESSLGKVLREGTLPDEVAALGLDEVAQPLAQVLERV
jgi:ABC-type lipoprotein export system ATPase subunit